MRRSGVAQKPLFSESDSHAAFQGFSQSLRHREHAASPERVQLLLFTLAAAFLFLSKLLRNPTEFPQLPTALLGTLGLSHTVYLGGKFGASLRGRKPPRPKGDLTS